MQHFTAYCVIALTVIALAVWIIRRALQQELEYDDAFERHMAESESSAYNPPHGDFL